MTPSDDDLRHLLREWRDTPPGDPNLASSVRRSIRERATTIGWRGTVESWFGSTRQGVRFAAACIAIGAGLGLAGAEWWRSQRERQMPERYLRWIEPVAVTETEAQR